MDNLDCRGCGLADTRTQIVWGDGSSEARLMFVGEAPGRWEDEEGIPFVGKAGDIFNSMLESTGIPRDDVYVTNIVKCRPWDGVANRKPTIEEVAACGVHLRREIEEVRPRVVCPMGATALAQFVPFKRISRVHGMRFHGRRVGFGYLIIPLYHPAVGIYNPAMIPVLHQDFQIVADIYRRELGSRE